MKSKLISLVLLLVFILQLLPVRQVVQYFGNNQVLIEEGIADCKAPVADCHEFTQCLLPQQYHLSRQYATGFTNCNAYYRNLIPSSHADDIETPPPNEVRS